MDKLGIDPDDVDPDQSRLLSGLSDTPDMYELNRFLTLHPFTHMSAGFRELRVSYLNC
jgi:hypothetical protein